VGVFFEHSVETITGVKSRLFSFCRS